MKYGLDVSTIGEYSHPQTLADLALEAEQAGWDGFFIWDTMTSSESPDQPIVDPWIALAAIVMKTSRIKIGALVTPSCDDFSCSPVERTYDLWHRLGL